MKYTILLFVATLFMLINSFGQKTDEKLIRKLEDKERQAILQGDTSALAELMSKNIVVQNPENAVVGFELIMDRIRQGKINYASFERKIDSISFVNGLAVVMGLEILIPQAGSQNAGKTVKRRFTNISTKENETWKFTVRQALIISIN